MKPIYLSLLLLTLNSLSHGQLLKPKHIVVDLGFSYMSPEIRRYPTTDRSDFVELTKEGRFSYPPSSLSLELKGNKWLGLGVCWYRQGTADYEFYSDPINSAYYVNFSRYYRIDYQRFLLLLNAHHNFGLKRFDFYLKSGFGFQKVKQYEEYRHYILDSVWTVERSYQPYCGMLRAGARFYFSQHIGLYLEAGLGGAYFMGGLSFKFGGKDKKQGKKEEEPVEPIQNEITPTEKE